MSFANICEAVKWWHYLWKPNFLFHLVDIRLCPNFPKNLDANIRVLLEVLQWVFFIRRNQKMYWWLNTSKHRSLACILHFPFTVSMSLCAHTHTHTHTYKHTQTLEHVCVYRYVLRNMFHVVVLTGSNCAHNVKTGIHKRMWIMT
jgi:hypothetical protein